MAPLVLAMAARLRQDRNHFWPPRDLIGVTWINRRIGEHGLELIRAVAEKNGVDVKADLVDQSFFEKTHRPIAPARFFYGLWASQRR